MVKCNRVNVKLSDLQLNKLKVLSKTIKEQLKNEYQNVQWG